MAERAAVEIKEAVVEGIGDDVGLISFFRPFLSLFALRIEYSFM